jgi:hypothetical protein
MHAIGYRHVKLDGNMWQGRKDLKGSRRGLFNSTTPDICVERLSKSTKDHIWDIP